MPLALCRVGQSFLTSQNPLLLDYLEFESAGQVRESFVRCSRREGPDGEQLVWESFTEEQATDFYKAYGANVQHVSEILRMNGLW